jgi:hypothetical protein
VAIAAQTASTVRAAAFRRKVLELGEDLFDWVQAGRVFWQEEDPCCDRADQLADSFAFVTAEIVEDHDIARTKRRQENVFYIGAKAFAIDRPFDKPGRINAIVA